MTGTLIKERLARGDRAARIGAFAFVSGAGLALDIGIFLSLTRLGWRAGFANLLSAFVAVTFVYFVSTRRIFRYQGRFLIALFAVYLAYQMAAVSFASWAVDSLVLFGLIPIVAKGMILPATFSANYVFMHLLTRARA